MTIQFWLVQTLRRHAHYPLCYGEGCGILGAGFLMGCVSAVGWLHLAEECRSASCQLFEGVEKG